MHPATWAVAAVALLIAACAGPNPEPGADTPASNATAAEPASPGTPDPGPRQAAIPPATIPPVTKPAPPSLPPEKLVGMDHQAVSKLLGRPQFRRADTPAELWRYRAGRCILDLFLYPPRGAPGGLLSVSHVEARLSDGAPASAPSCLDAILKARAGAGTT